jgi:hypothetical protein
MSGSDAREDVPAAPAAPPADDAPPSEELSSSSEDASPREAPAAAPAGGSGGARRRWADAPVTAPARADGASAVGMALLGAAGLVLLTSALEAGWRAFRGASRRRRKRRTRKPSATSSAPSSPPAAPAQSSKLRAYQARAPRVRALGAQRAGLPWRARGAPSPACAQFRRAIISPFPRRLAFAANTAAP